MDRRLMLILVGWALLGTGLVLLIIPFVSGILGNQFGPLSTLWPLLVAGGGCVVAGPVIQLTRIPRSEWRSWLGSPAAMLPLVLVGAIVVVLLAASGLKNFGWSFWSFNYLFNPLTDSGSFGIGVFAVGTAITAVMALFFAGLLSLAIAISLTVYLPPIASRPLAILTNLLAGIPSVVYGIWGYVILAPYFGSTLEPTLQNVIGFIPGFGGGAAETAGGTGLLLAVFILTIMVIPLTAAIMRESLRNVPKDLVEAGLALGATQWEVTRQVRFRVARGGIWGAAFLGFGRAIGEAVAVAMLIGASVQIPSTIYGGSTTIASFIFYQLDSAFTYPTLLQALVEYALVLLAIAVIVNVVGQRATRSDTIAAVAGGF